MFEAAIFQGEAVSVISEASIVQAEDVIMCLRLLLFRARLFL